MSTDQMTHSPLTILSDDEAMFRDAVAGFANEEVRPRVQQMERDGKDRSRADHEVLRDGPHGHRGRRMSTAAPTVRASWSRSASRRSARSIRRRRF